MNETEMQRLIGELQESLEIERGANKILGDLVGELQVELEYVKHQRNMAFADIRKDCRLCANSVENNGTGEFCKTPCMNGNNFIYRGLNLKGKG